LLYIFKTSSRYQAGHVQTKRPQKQGQSPVEDFCCPFLLSFSPEASKYTPLLSHPTSALRPQGAFARHPARGAASLHASLAVPLQLLGMFGKLLPRTWLLTTNCHQFLMSHL